jgi:hypothetical protein
MADDGDKPVKHAPTIADWHCVSIRGRLVPVEHREWHGTAHLRRIDVAACMNAFFFIARSSVRAAEQCMNEIVPELRTTLTSTSNAEKSERLADRSIPSKH